MPVPAPAPSADAPAPPDALDALRRALGDRYAVERELGRGGMGAVYLARDLRLDRAVALKVLPAQFATQVALRERFLLETRTAASFSHPNIVPVYAVEETADLLAYAMGLVEGETLAERVRRVGPLPVRELVRLLQDVGYALAYAHGRGVVHRDIKPDNIMVERATGRALVMDFGISRTMTPTVRAAALTRVGEVVGSPEYMSPEQASGDHVDGRSDLYSLGLTAHFAATGSVVMTGESTQKILVRQLTEAVPSIGDARPDLPAALAEAVDRCVAKDPAERFQRAEELVEAIDAAQLAAPEVPVAVRVFAGELDTLSMLAAGGFLVGLLVVPAALRDGASELEAIFPIAGVAAVIFMRVLTALADAGRLAEAGFTPHEVMAGMSRVVAERAELRDELRANPAVRARRRRTLLWGIGMFVLSAALLRIGREMRIVLDDDRFRITPAGVSLLFTGIVLGGMSLVLIARSPFRMTPGERFFRRFWLGAPGRAFVRLAARRAGTSSASSLASTRAMPLTGTPVRAAPVAAAPSLPADGGRDRLAALEARVAELERWRDAR